MRSGPRMLCALPCRAFRCAGVVWYTLKDAADRGRLGASTFRQLNLAMAVLAALQLWGLWQMAYLVRPQLLPTHCATSLHPVLDSPRCRRKQGADSRAFQM